MENILQQKIIAGDRIFSSLLLDTKAFYMYRFNAIPSVQFVYNVNGEKASIAFLQAFATAIADIYRYTEVPARKKQGEHNTTCVVLKEECVLEFGEEYCEILHNGRQEALLNNITAFLCRFRNRAKRRKFEISLIVRNNASFGLKSMAYRRTRLNLALYYEDDFAAVDSIIYKRLSTPNDSGIVLLHGLPGTGKTTYLRYLIGRMKKRVLFLSPGLGASVTDPDFIDLLIANPNCVLVIEDAENLIMDRKLGGNSAVSGLLNLSDGLLADCLNVQVICTFNSDLSLVDGALMRKGRLIARYEFGRLSVPRAQQLSDHLGFKTRVQRPMSIAEIVNQHAPAFEQQSRAIGFQSLLQ